MKAGTKGEKARGGLDFHLLARGTERSYSTGYLVNLDQHTLGLVGDNVKKSNFSLGLDSLVTHAKRIFDQVCLAVLMLNSLISVDKTVILLCFLQTK